MVARHDPGARDVVIDIAFTGICHSDIDHAYDVRGNTRYPLVPGHEIAGVVTAVGSRVTKFKVGDHAGIGVMVGSCRICESCRSGLEQYCSGTRIMTYGSIGRDGEPTYGGYSQAIVVDEDFALRIPQSLPLAQAAPLLCAGITLYSPLRHWKAGPGKRVGIIGFGGLGHVGVQIARAMGATTIVFDLNDAKRADALRLGGDEFKLAADPTSFRDLAASLDLVISTVPAQIDLDAYLGLLGRDGTFVILGVPDQALSIQPFSLLRNRRQLAGSLTGGLAEMQEMLDFCATNGIGAEVEVIDADQIDEAFRRLQAGDVRYRFVIDATTYAQR